MGALGVVEPERPGRCVEHGLRRGEITSLLRTDVVVDADPRQRRELLSAKPWHPTPTARSQADIYGLKPIAPGLREFTQLRLRGHRESMARQGVRNGNIIEVDARQFIGPRGTID